MLNNLTIQKRFTIMASVPMAIIAVVACGGLIFLDPQSGVRPYGIFALVGMVGTGIFALVLSQSIGRTLTETAESARKLALAQEAVLVGDETPLNELTPLPTPQGEFGDLNSSLNAVQAGSLKLIASQRGAVKEGLSTIVVNLARRNQSLLDRQVEFIEKLEHNEEDPDTLENLFTVDHLATRMRRNAESLLVLAQAEPGKRRGGPVDATDVLRVAIGEIENYTHIKLGSVAPGRLSPTHAIDLAHLLAELMENATQFCPPETPVQVYSDQLSDAYVVSVADFGMGMSGEVMPESNRTLADPPELGLAMTRSLGFVVVGRLAERLGASVQLYPSSGSGVTAEIVLPNSLLLPASDHSGDGVTPKVGFSRAPATAVPKADALPDKSSTDPKISDAAAKNSVQPNHGDASSPALARLLGLGASPLPKPEAEPETAAPGDWQGRSPFEDDKTANKSEHEAESDAAFDPFPTTWTPPPVTPDAPSMTAQLSEALPTGGDLEAGMESLLRSESDSRSAGEGLTKRSRSESRAPKSEGRVVPDGNRPLAAVNSRKPEEIRSMLLQYRAGLKGTKPSDDATNVDDKTPATKEQDPS